MTKKLAVVVALCALATLAAAVPASAQSYPPTAVVQAEQFAISPPLRDLVPEAFQPPKEAIQDKPINETNTKIIKFFAPGAESMTSVDGAIQGSAAAPAIPGPALTWEAIKADDLPGLIGFRVMPPDTVGDVGPNHYVQMVNSAWNVYNKATGATLLPGGPRSLASIWASIPGACATSNDGDPIVLYDPLADRWMLSQFCLITNPRPHQLIAISTSADPTGSYYLYDFVMPNDKINDYPHFGVWPDAYYMSDNQFDFGFTTFLGAGIFAFDRAKMLLGDPTASYVYFDVAPIDPFAGGMLPTDLDGNIPPPAGLPNLFIEFRADEFGDPLDALRIYEVVPNFVTPASSTLTIRPDVAVAAFDARQPTGRDDVEQPAPAGTTAYLDSIADRLMHRLAYRNLGSYASPVNSWVMNWSTNVSGVNPTGFATFQAGIRWTELRRSGAGVYSINNQGTYAPGAGDGVNGRNIWMGSIAQDFQGNMALGFSASSLTLVPSILWAGRLAGDPAGTMGQGEATMFAGVGIQTDTNSRWGDYSAMSVDPVDDCTFWYTQQYNANNGSFDWTTRVGNFKFAGCTAAPKGGLQGTVTNCSGGAPIANAVVTATGGFMTTTSATGFYSFPAIAPATYNMSASKLSAGFGVTNVNNVVVTNGATTTQNFCLTPTAIINPAGSSLVSEGCGPANGAIDPNETVTVSFCVNNTGGINTTNLVGTLQATGGVTSPSAPQSYGVVVAGGAAVCRNFTFTAAGTCGGALTATIQFQDGATNHGTRDYNFTLGALNVALAQNFDSVAAPALPVGWQAINTTGPAPLWVTSTTTPDTAPNAAFIDDPSVVSDKRLESVTFAINTTVAQLSFRNFFNLESGFDGGVLEVKIGGGAFQDIEAAGGSFVTGGYTAAISTSFGNPIGGRRAWTGNSTSYINTVVNLPAAAAGQSIQLRFRMGSDSSVSGTGWRIDTLQVRDGYTCCIGCTLTCPANQVVNNDPGVCGAVRSFTPTATPGCGTVTCAPPSGSFFPAEATTPVNCSSQFGGQSCSFTIRVEDVEAPVLSCPAEVEVFATPTEGGRVATWPIPAVSDNCAGPGAASCAPPSGTFFPLGVTPISCGAIDAAGNPGGCNFNVEVIARSVTEIPTLSGLGLALLVLLLGSAGVLLVLRRRTAN